MTQKSQTELNRILFLALIELNIILSSHNSLIVRVYPVFSFFLVSIVRHDIHASVHRVSSEKKGKERKNGAASSFLVGQRRKEDWRIKKKKKSRLHAIL